MEVAKNPVQLTSAAYVPTDYLSLAANVSFNSNNNELPFTNLSIEVSLGLMQVQKVGTEGVHYLFFEEC